MIRKIRSSRFLMAIFLVLFCLVVATNTSIRLENKSKSQPLMSAASGPITIHGNAELDAYMVGKGQGSGTEEDPYILQDLQVTSTGGVHCIYLTDVNNRHLTIITCSMILLDDVGASGYGVYLSNSGNITIDGCSFNNWDCTTYTTTYGVYSTSGANITVRDCVFSTIYTKSFVGVSVSSTDGSIVEGNTFTNLHTSSSLLFPILSAGSWNTIQDNYFGVNYSSATSVRCIYLSPSSSSNIVKNNTVDEIQTGSSFGAIFIEGNGNFVLQNNLFSGTSQIGSDTYGIRISATGENNIISGNFIGAGGQPTRDFGSGNVWYRYDYFPAMSRYQNVGNYYWNYTGSDANGDHIGDTPYAIYSTSDPAPIMYSGMDNDGDGLFNHEETTHETDANNRDTDGDGWTDYQEVKLYGTNPLAQDTDGDGKLDPADETPNYADPGVPTANMTADTDCDGLTDYEEIHDYKTNPVNNDTDGDGWTDYDELKVYGTDPLSRDSDRDGLIDSEDPYPNQPEVTTTAPVDYTKTIYYITGAVCASMIVLAVALLVHGRRGKPNHTGEKSNTKSSGKSKVTRVPDSRKK